MKLRVFKSIENLIYVVRFENDVTAISNSDKELMQKFGEPEINMGGTFLAESELEYTLPDRYVRIRSDFPQRVELDSRSSPFDADTQDKVNGYVTEMIAKFNAAVSTLRENTDSFTSEIIENV